MEYNKYKVLLSNTAVFAVGNILVKLIAFVLMPLYTSVLTTKEYGISELLNSTTEIIIPLATVCIIEALYRFSIDKNADYKSLFSNFIGTKYFALITSSSIFSSKLRITSALLA